MAYLVLINTNLILIIPSGIKLLLERKVLKFMNEKSGIFCYTKWKKSANLEIFNTIIKIGMEFRVALQHELINI